MSWPEQQAIWRRQYAELGLPVPDQPLVPPYQPTPANQVARNFGLQLALAATPFPFTRQLGTAARSVGNFFAPRQVGVHHTLYGRGLDAPLFKPWNTPRVRPSTSYGATAGDQIPGMSYFWSGRGRGGSAAAANEAKGQTNLMFQNYVLEPGTQGVGKVVTSPRFGPRPDPNLLGTRATMVQGPRLRVTGEVAARSGPLSSADSSLLSLMANRQKLIEASRSAGRIGVAAGAGVGSQNFDMAAIRQMLR